MNFFGHCVVAAGQSTDPRFLLGAMLPDFATMLRLPVPGTSCEQTAAGIRHHHETDRVFHQGPQFTLHQRQARERLNALGVRRGPTLGVAHVGVELILDAHLAELSDGRGLYPLALHSATRLLEQGLLSFSREGAEERFRSTLHWLLERTEFVVPASPQNVAERMHRILSNRPSLALRAQELDAVAAWASSVWEPIKQQAPEWLATLEQQLLGQPSG